MAVDVRDLSRSPTPAGPDVLAGGARPRRRARPSGAGLAARAGVLAVPALVVAGIAAFGSQDLAGVGYRSAIYAMIGLSLNILIGYTGQLSLGQQGFLGVGAATAAYFSAKQGFGMELSLPVATLVGAVFALLLGLVALRITGLYLALITLVFGLTLSVSLFEVAALTNAGAGQPANRPDALISNNRYFLLCLAVLALVVYLDVRLLRTKAGRALLALKENERVAEAFGVDVTAYKLLAFVLSGAVAGLAGGLFAYGSQIFNGNDYNFVPLGLTFVIMTVVGGAGSRVGVILGSVLFEVLGDSYVLGKLNFFSSLPGFLGENYKQLPQLLGLVLFLLTLTLNPGGIAQQLRPLTRWLGGAPFSLHGDDSGPAAVEGSSVRA